MFELLVPIFFFTDQDLVGMVRCFVLSVTGHVTDVSSPVLIIAKQLCFRSSTAASLEAEGLPLN